MEDQGVIHDMDILSKTKMKYGKEPAKLSGHP